MSELEEIDLKFTAKERGHLTALDRRLKHLQGDHPERRSDPAYPGGEAAALAWALSIIRETVQPTDIRLERVERAVRTAYSRIAILERLIEEEE